MTDQDEAPELGNEFFDNATQIYPLLYKLDSLGKLRTWRMKRCGAQHCTLAGLADGKQATSGWTTCVGKQGRTDEEQAIFEVKAQYKHQLDREYHETPDTVSTPKMIEPMLAKTYASWPGPGYAQPKLDGIRCIMTAAGMFTRQGQPIVAVPHLHAAAAPLFADDPDLILDGELYNHDLREDFGAISSIVRKKNPTADQFAAAERVMQYHVYDIVDPETNYRDRKQRILQLLGELGCDWLVYVPAIKCDSAGEADDAYGEAVAAGYEGGMYRLDTPYEIGRRSKSLLKRKEFETAEFRLLDLEEGNGNWAGAAKRAILENDQNEGKPFGAGIRGSYPALKQLLADWRTNETWRTAGVAVVTLRFFGRSPDGVPRFPVVIDFHMEGRND